MPQTKGGGMEISMKKNLCFRELLMYIILIDICSNLVYYVIDFNSLTRFENILRVVEIIIRILFEYLLMFYLWFPIRYEKYKPSNPNLHILEWTVCLFLEILFCVIFSPKNNLECMLFSIIVFVYLFMLFRYLDIYRRKYRVEKCEFNIQMEKDIPVILPLVGMLPISAMGFGFNHTNIVYIIISVIYIWFVVVCTLLYCVHSTRFVLEQEISKKRLIITVFHSIIFFFLLILGILLCQTNENILLIEKIGLVICYILFNVLGTLLFIYNTNRMITFKENIKRLN